MFRSLSLRYVRRGVTQFIRGHGSKGVLFSTTAFAAKPLESFSVIKEHSLGSQMRTTSLTALGEATKLLDLYFTALESLITDYTRVVHSLCLIYEAEKVLREEHADYLLLTDRMNLLKKEILEMQQLQEYVTESVENATRASFLLGNVAVSEQSWEKIVSFKKKMEILSEKFNSLALELTRAKVVHIELVSKMVDAGELDSDDNKDYEETTDSNS